jgi:predicted GIY-YIG superfamily endonuclease
MSDAGIYAITNTASGRAYIGSARNVAARLAAHRRSLERGDHFVEALQTDWLALGAGAFTFEQIETCEPTERALHEAEERQIAACASVYNRFGAHRWRERPVDRREPLPDDFIWQLLSLGARVRAEHVPDEIEQRWSAVEESLRDSLARLDAVDERLARVGRA